MKHVAIRSSVRGWMALSPAMAVLAGLSLVFTVGIGPVSARIGAPGRPSAPLEVAPGWDLQGIFDPAVIKDAGTLSMWYTAWGLDGRMRVGYATSTDGTTWQRYGTQPVLDVGPSGAWDEWQARVGAVLKDGATYRMWYWCNAGVGYATSPDGIHWTKHAGNPVLTAGPSGAWDVGLVQHLTVLKDGELYKMWYSAMTAAGANGPASIGYATSPDGIAWTKDDGNPVLNPGASGWDAGWAFDPTVIRNGDSYMMWYSGTDGYPSSPVTMRIGLATSPDGVTWTKSMSNPVMDVAPDSWEQTSVTGPWVILDGSEYRMWYHGGPWGPHDMIGYATSSDGVTWTKYERNPVLRNSYVYLPLMQKPGQPVDMLLLPKFMGVTAFDEVNQGAQEAKTDLGNAGRLTYIGPTRDNSVAGQIEIVTYAASQGYKAIMISNNAGDEIVPAVQAARDKGLTVVTWDSPIPSAQGEQVFVAQVDWNYTGEVMADMALDILGANGGEFAVLSASPDAANQNAWIADLKEVLKDPKYAKLNLIDVVYGNDNHDDSYNQALALVTKYPAMKLIMAPTTIGIAAAAQAMQDHSLCDKVKVSGLGLPSDMAAFTKNGCAPEFALWSFVDLGYLTYYVTYRIATGELKPEEGATLEAGRMGTYTITKDPTRDNGLRVLMGFTVYTKDNLP